MATFRALFFAAVIAGIAAGAVVSVIQAVKMWPLIAAAEVLETTAPPHHDHDHAQSEPAWPPEGPLRPALTVVFNMAAGLGFALILNALARLRSLRDGRVLTAEAGVLWGLAGFAAFSLAPAVGLPPELPGMAAGALVQRQIWWAVTACATAGGIATLVHASAFWRIGGIALIIAPHVFGAPHAAEHGVIPGEMAAAFASASLAASAVFWVVLGWVSGWAQQRFFRAL